MVRSLLEGRSSRQKPQPRLRQTHGDVMVNVRVEKEEGAEGEVVERDTRQRDERRKPDSSREEVKRHLF